MKSIFWHFTTAICTTTLIISLVMPHNLFAQSARQASGTVYRTGSVVNPGTDTKSASEYFSSDPRHQTLIPVNIWGAVGTPGIYYLPAQYSLVAALSAAGGPHLYAKRTVTVNRNQQNLSVDLSKEGHLFRIQEGDTITIEKGIRDDLPLLFSALSAVLTVTTLVFVIRNGRR